MHDSLAVGAASTSQPDAATSSSSNATGWTSWTDDLADIGSTEQRRLRHLTEILIRNLHVPTATSATQAQQRHQQRLAQLQQNHFDDRAGARDRAPGQTSASLSPSRIRKTLRPGASRRFLSYDDSDITYSQLESSTSGSMLPNGEGLQPLPALRRQGSYLRSAEKRRRRAASNSVLDVPSIGVPLSPSSKGKEKALEPPPLNGHLPKHEGDFELANGHHGFPPTEDLDSDVVFGWMSAGPPALNRTKSDRSMKSGTSRRSSMSQRLFRKRDLKPRHSESDEDEDPRPTSPHANHVSFQITESPSLPISLDAAGNLVEDALPYFSHRDRSASLYSFASASSGSTIHPLPPILPAESRPRPPRISEEDVSHRHRDKSYAKSSHRTLYRTRITLSLPTDAATASKEGLPLRQDFGRPFPSHSPRHQSPSTRQRLLKQRSLDRLRHTHASAPFFTSSTHRPSTEPSFAVDAATLALDLSKADEQHLNRIDRVKVSLWIDSTSAITKSNSSHAPAWQLLTEWDIDMQGLISLGSDPKLFPHTLPKNTLILRLSCSDDYYTARLPLFVRDDTLREEGEDSDSSLSSAEEADGNVSDPGPDTLSRSRSRRAAQNIGRDHMDRLRILARRQIIYERSLRETKMLPCCDDEALEHLMRLSQQLQQGRQEDLLRRSRIDSMLDGEVMRHHRQHHNQKHVTSVRRQDLDSVHTATARISRDREQLQDSLASRRANLATARKLLQHKQFALEQHGIELQHDRTIVTSIKLSSTQRRATLISDVANIFPIELLDSSNLLFSICGVALPNGSLDPAQQPAIASTIPMDDDTLSSGIGFVAQAVQLLAAYMSIPLHYPLICLGSRTVVQDPISQIKGSKVFPLYARGVDRYRFDYGMFLLNKDIEQLMLENGIVVLDIGQTLPNLKNLLLTLSSDTPIQLAAMSDKPVVLNSLDSPWPSQETESHLSISSSPPSVAGSPRLAKLKRELQQQGVMRTSSNLGKPPTTASSMALEKLLEASMILGTRSIAERPRVNGQ